jgi:hypothetical protein
MSEQRDVYLGARLDELDVPEHAEGYWASLMATLEPELESLRQESEGQAEQAPAIPSRAPRERRSWSLWTRHPVLATAAAVGIAAAVAAAVLIGLPGVSRISGPEPVSAAQVIQKALQALSLGKTVQAEATDKFAVAILPGGVTEYAVEHDRLIMRSDGSFRSTQTDEPQTSKPVQMRNRADAADTAYDAVTGVLREYSRGWDWDAGPRGSYVDRFEVTTGHPIGPPDRWANVLLDSVSALARALRAGGVVTLETTSYEGRPVWVLWGSKRAGSDPRLTGDETYSITVDQETCLPIRFRLFDDGVLQHEYSWHDVRVDQPLPDKAFTFAPPKGAEVVRKDAGFRRLPLARISSKAGYVTLLPAWLPDGFVQKWSAVAARSTTANGVTEGRRVVAVQYVRGFDSLTVTTRAVTDPRSAAAVDPIEYETTWANTVRRDIRLTAGAFAGVTAAVVVAPWTTTPHLYAVKDGVLLTVAGSATARELTAIAESLRLDRPD